jgi:hypothetical protein
MQRDMVLYLLGYGQGHLKNTSALSGRQFLRARMTRMWQLALPRRTTELNGA